MAEKIVHYSDLSGVPAEEAGELIPVVVLEHPDIEAPVRLEVTPGELEQIGKFAMASTVQIQTEKSGDEEQSRFVLTATNFGKLVVGRTVAEVLADAKPAEPAKPGRRSHNKTADGRPLVNYNESEHAGLPHYGRIGKVEAEYVRTNLELVNERRVAAGHPPIDPANPDDAKRYGFVTGE
jgi:hypothetical protein